LANEIQIKINYEISQIDKLIIDCLVLGAFGCGAFANPPNHMAELFKEVLLEKEFIKKFKFIVFSIFEDHNSNKRHNPNGNVLPFLEVFDSVL